MYEHTFLFSSLQPGVVNPERSLVKSIDAMCSSTPVSRKAFERWLLSMKRINLDRDLRESFDSVMVRGLSVLGISLFWRFWWCVTDSLVEADKPSFTPEFFWLTVPVYRYFCEKELTNLFQVRRLKHQLFCFWVIATAGNHEFLSWWGAKKVNQATAVTIRYARNYVDL